MKRKRLVYLMVFGILSLTACQNQQGGKALPETALSSGTDETAASSQAVQESAAGAVQAVRTESDYSPVLAEGYQFVEGMGIVPPGEAVFYQMDIDHPLVLKNEYATAYLLNAVYQDNTFSIRVIIWDHSVSLMTEEEGRQLEASGSGDDSYFLIDEERSLYAKSAFREMQNAISAAYKGRGDSGLLYGHGIPDIGFSFNASSTNAHDEFLEKGYNTSAIQLVKADARFLTKEPEGIYQLKLMGFEQPFSFTFSKVPEYGTLEEIPGIVEKDGFYFLTTGRRWEDTIHVLSHVFPKPGCQTSIQSQRAVLKSGEREYPVHRNESVGIPMAMKGEAFPGIYNKEVVELVYDMKETDDVTGLELISDNVRFHTEETSEIYHFSVPKQEEALDIQVDFQDGRLSIGETGPVDEMLGGVWNEGNEVLTPAFFLAASGTAKSEKHKLQSVFALCGEEAIAAGYEKAWYGMAYGIRMAEGNPEKDWEHQEITGFKIPYREGETDIPVVFCRPGYRWEDTFVFPVQTDGIS